MGLTNDEMLFEDPLSHLNILLAVRHYSQGYSLDFDSVKNPNFRRFQLSETLRLCYCHLNNEAVAESKAIAGVYYIKLDMSFLTIYKKTPTLLLGFCKIWCKKIDEETRVLL